MTPPNERASGARPRLSDVRRGAMLAVVTAAVSGVAIYLNAFAVRQVPDPAVYTTLKNGVAAVCLLGLLAATGRGQVAGLRPRQWGGLALIGLVGGSVPFLLFFSGLAQASAPSAAFIHKTLFVWVALLAVPLLGERLGWAQIGALGALLAAQLLIAAPSGVRWGSGETLIAAATLLWAIEVIVARRLLAGMGSTVAAAGRMGFGLVILVGYLALSGKLSSIAALDAAAWAWVVLTGLLLTAYVATWYAALRLAPASLVTSVLTLGAVVTAGLQTLGAAQAPAPLALAGYGLMLAAGAAIVLVSGRPPAVAAPAVARA